MSTDPVAEKSGFLRMYMSNHPDTLVAYAKYYGKVTEAITSAEMTSIDSRNMTLACLLKSGSKKEVRIPLDPPLSGYDEVKPRLLEMKAVAQEQLGMIKVPTITTFRLPPDTLKSGALVAIVIYFAFASIDNPSPLFTPARLVNSLVGPKPGLYGFYFLAGAHLLESLYTLSLCWKHGTGFFVGAAYVVSTLIFGFPTWQDFRKRIQAARINSVMKVE